MATKKCKVCDKAYRKGRIAFIIVGNTVKGARVCQTCAGDGVLLVAAKPAVRVVTSTGVPVAAEVLKNLKAQVKALKAFPGSPDPNDPDERLLEQFHMGKIEGMENAIAALTKGSA